MSSNTEPTQSFSLTEGQLIFLRYMLDRGFTEFLEYARDSTAPPDDFTRVHADMIVDLCEIFGMEIPQVPDKS
ncbi:hypothetical protein AB0H76_39020 [Nocardia sp. NPDC050712]|uniref:hypothetical protein n=1 Tax=Nocardia sp. NPDC050712 TaxID=3155518 RepID=UPI0033C0E906